MFDFSAKWKTIAEKSLVNDKNCSRSGLVRPTDEKDLNKNYG